MTYGSEIKNGERIGYFHLTDQEVKDFEAGKPIIKHSGDCKGHFKITLKMTRPRTKKERFRGL